jgi:cytochrome c-type protein NapC
MAGGTTIVIAVILISIALIAYLTLRPSITATRGGKMLAFVALLVFPLLAGGMGASAHLAHSTTTGFCLSCHVMEPYGKSLLVDDRSFIPAVHYQNHLVPRNNACYTCHTDYAMFGGLRSKLRGLNHVYVQYFGTVPEHPKLYNPYNNRECLHCHLGARSFEEGATHNQDPKTMELVKSNQLGCTSAGCHNMVHNITQLKDATFWKEPSQ